MTPASKMDFKKIQNVIHTLARSDRTTQFMTKIGDNPAALDANLAMIEELCAAIRQQEGLTVKEIETWTSATGTHRVVCHNKFGG